MAADAMERERIGFDADGYGSGNRGTLNNGNRTGVKSAGDQKHNLILDDRKSLSMTGVLDVDNYDEHMVTVRTTRGILTVEGDGLHVCRLTLENGELILDGSIAALYYTQESQAQSGNGGFFARLFH